MFSNFTDTPSISKLFKGSYESYKNAPFSIFLIFDKSSFFNDGQITFRSETAPSVIVNLVLARDSSIRLWRGLWSENWLKWLRNSILSILSYD